MIALLHDDEVRAPAPGWFRLLVAPDHLVAPGDVIGELDILGRIVRVTAPAVRGIVKLPTISPGVPALAASSGASAPAAARRAVSYGDVLFTVATDVAIAGVEATKQAEAVGGLVFRAPTSGRFYGRPAPDKPPFVVAGVELATGATVCLLEVMKSFHRVTYGGPDVPPRALVREVVVADGADVNQGDPLLALDPMEAGL